MYNYKFNEDFIDNANEYLKSDIKLQNMIDKIEYLKNNFVSDLIEFNKDNILPKFDSSENSSIDKQIFDVVVDHPNVFSEEKLKEIYAFGDEIKNCINAINFEKFSLIQQKNEAMAKFDIPTVIKFDNKIDRLESKLTDISDEIVRYNNEIKMDEIHFFEDYAKFIDDIKDIKDKSSIDYDNLKKEYGANIVDYYILNVIINALNTYFSGVEKSEVSEIISNNPKIVDVLGDYYNAVVESYK